MKVKVAEYAGYCYGVERALKITQKASENSSLPIYTLGPIIHNPQVVESLKKKGIKPVEKLEDIEEGILIIRSHGVNPRIADKANSKGLKVIDATCPFVKKVQHCAQQLEREGYQLIIVGEREHPEVKGIRAYASNKAILVEKPSDIPILREGIRVGIVVQTTQPFEKLEQVVNEVLAVSAELKVFNTICDATVKRQDAARKLAKKVDVVVVVGGKNSANTTRLAEICRAEGTTTYHIETAEEIEKQWFNKDMEVGVTAGASTPDWLLKEVVDRLEKM